ncbi:hypothetical protein CEXT_142091 [Caerostris extrusa]|uniref:RNase H type-1 domain-containing protein n=1 Tax=Caerostris extrusa TaxID=172846 RepID=A0AAV4UGV5_CAEEX|nr:hypothetical protein CEXT_142091 [Caerostris extrusa]
MKESKSDAIKAALLAYTLEKIHTLYPTDDWFNIYTEGSLFLWVPQQLILMPKSRLASELSTTLIVQFLCDSELSLIYGHECITTHNKIVLIDSCAVVQTLESLQKNDTTREYYFLKNLINGLTITLQWIPNHCGIPSNECADRLAKGWLLLAPAAILLPITR